MGRKPCSRAKVRAPTSAFHGLQHGVAGRKNTFGVVECQAAPVRPLQAADLPTEQFVAERFFKAMNLNRN